MARKGKKKGSTATASSPVPEPMPMDVSDPTSSADAARAAATHAQNLANQSLGAAPDAQMGSSFNMFDQPQLNGARAGQESSQDDDAQAMTSQATAGLMQLANATQAMTGATDGRRMLAPAQGGQDYMEVDGEAAEFQQADAPAPTRGRKRKKRAAGDNPRPAKKRQPAQSGLAQPAQPNATFNTAFPSSGPFTVAEKELVDSFVTAFRDIHQIDAEVLNDLVQSKERKMDETARAFWSEVYGILPNRDNKAMQRHLRRRYHNYSVRGKWTPEEDDALKAAYEDKPNQWTHIGRVLERMPEDCRDRWRNYVVCGENRKTDHWDAEEERTLAEAVNECIQKIKDDARAKAKDEGHAFREEQDWEALLNFNTVSEKLEHTRSRIQCLQHWKAMGIREAEGRTKRRNRKAGDQMPTPSRARSNVKGERHETPRIKYKKMLPGDKHRILTDVLMNSEVYDEDKVNWGLLTQRSGLRYWTPKERKFVWTKAKKTMTFEPESTFVDCVGQVLAALEEQHPDELEHFYDWSEEPDANDRDRLYSYPQEAAAGDDEEFPELQQLVRPAEPAETGEHGEQQIDPQLQPQSSPASGKKKGRGAGRKPRKSNKQFKSADRVEEDAVEEQPQQQQKAAPTANMGTFPSNPYADIEETVEKVYKKKRGRPSKKDREEMARAQAQAEDAQAEVDSEVELPPNGAAHAAAETED